MACGKCVSCISHTPYSIIYAASPRKHFKMWTRRDAPGPHLKNRRAPTALASDHNENQTRSDRSGPRAGLAIVWFLALFGDGVRWDFDGYAIAGGGIRVVGLGRCRWGRHQIVADGANETLDTIPASRVTVRVELLLALAVVNVEDVVLVLKTVIDFGVGDTCQFQYLQAGARSRLRIRAELFRVLGSRFYQAYGYLPHVHRHSLWWGVGMQCFVDLGIVDQLAIGLDKVLLRNGFAAHDLGLHAQVEAAYDLAMAYNLAGATTVGAESGSSPLTGGTDALAVAASAIDFAIDAIGAGDGLSFGCRVCISRIGDGYALLSNTLEDIRDLFIDGGGDILGLLLEEGLLLTLPPISNVAAPATGGAAFLGAAFAIGADNPAAPGTGSTQGTPHAITDSTGEDLVQSFEARASCRRLEAGYGRQLVVPD